MSYNPNQQYNPALRRDAVQSGGDPYQSQQQFAVQQGQVSVVFVMSVFVLVSMVSSTKFLCFVF